MERECFYKDRTEIVRQKCGGRVEFGVKGFFEKEPKPDAGIDLFLCYCHHKWWNKTVSDGCFICRATKMPHSHRIGP